MHVSSRKSHVRSRSRWNGQSSVAIAHRRTLRVGRARTMSFYAFARFKEIHPLWIMPRFSVRWRASRIQYLRPLSSYSLLGARAALGNGRIVIVIEARGLSSSSSSSPLSSSSCSALCRWPGWPYHILDSHSACTYPACAIASHCT